VLPDLRGSGTVAVELASALATRGHEVHVVSYAPPVRLLPQRGLSYHEVNVSAYPLFKYPPYEMALASKLADLAKRHRLDILHAHYAVPHSLSAVLAREIVGRDKVRVVTTLHGTDVTLVGSDPAYRPIVEYALARADGITAVSKFLRDETRRVIHDAPRIAAIPNFVDTAVFHPEAQGSMRACLAYGDEAILVHVSNFRPVKRVGDVVKIYAGVRARMNARLVMVGDGPERSTALRTAEELGVADGVLFSARSPTSRRSSEPRTRSSCRPMANRSASRRLKRWRAACRLSGPTRAVSPKSCVTASTAS
jgi:N-acetyl-alpha-D-glucosaminyl L-malate synthase BshA